MSATRYAIMAKSKGRRTVPGAAFVAALEAGVASQRAMARIRLYRSDGAALPSAATMVAVVAMIRPLDGD